jgi:hypothetical protein
MMHSENKEAPVAESTRLDKRAPALNAKTGDFQQESGDWSFDDEEILDETVDEKDDKLPTQPFVNESVKKVEQQMPSAALVMDRLASDKSSGANNSQHDAKLSCHAAGIKPPETNVPSQPPPIKPPVDEWSFDDDSFLDAADNEAPTNLNAKQEATFQSLVRYMESLPALLPSLNAVLEAEYNTYHHAVELTEYYKSRPQLFDYTLDTELPRMDYQVVLSSQERLLDKYQVQQHFLSKKNSPVEILIRSANQSLLADLLAQLTGPDCLIRHEYLATAVATSCQFVLHPSFVECHCSLTLSLPSATGDRLDVALLVVSIDFAQPPAVHYHLHKVERILADLSELRETAVFLSSLDQEFLNEDENPPTSDDVVRDVFMAKLCKTQQFAKDSHAGLSSAWKQIDSVANVSKKMNFLKLPTNDVLAAASHEEALASRPRPPPPTKREPMPSANVPPPPPSPNRPRPPPSSGNLEPQSRPAPILGGLLRTGWNRLAQTVVLPDEVDTFPINEPTPTIPKLYQVENERLVNDRKTQSYVPPPPPPPQQQPQKTFEKPASSLQQPSAMPDAKQELHEVIASEEDFQDGWGEDDLDVDDEDATNIVDEAVNKLQPPPPPPQRPSQPTATSTTTAPPLLPPKHAQKSITKMGPPSPSVASRMDVSPQAPPLLNYNPEDDIVPTRKRWVNPRPGNRQLRV